LTPPSKAHVFDEIALVKPRLCKDISPCHRFRPACSND
jgi:hypothetical protein